MSDPKPTPPQTDATQVQDVPREDGGRKRRPNAADEHQVRHAQDEANKARAQRREDWKWMCSNPQGLRILRDLLKPIGQSPYDGHATNMAKLCGQLEAAIWVRERVWDSCPEALALMLAQDIETARRERAQTDR